MQPTLCRRSTTHFFTAALRLAIVLALLSSILFFSTPAQAQDTPGRFEIGTSFNVARLGFITDIGPGVEGDWNFGRHFALDGSYSWLPRSEVHFMTGFFGAKVGTRTQHFGFFGKVRPGFISLAGMEREATEVFDPQTFTSSLSSRFARLNERALDLGGVVEYYPARQWALRWDFGDLMQFQEPGPTLTTITLGSPGAVVTTILPGGTYNHFQCSIGIHYRF